MQYIINSRNRYRKELVENIMPFWMNNGLDKVNGGVYTCLDRDGTIIDSTKSVWFQGRFGFVCAYAYNNIEKNEEWLAASKSCIDFIEKNCIDTDGHFFYEVKADGTPLRRRRYLFSECFAIIAMAEYSVASGDKSYANKAMELFRFVKRAMGNPQFQPPKYLNIELRGHSLTMILINTAQCLINAGVEDELLEQTISESIFQIENYFLHPEFKAVLETVGPNGEFIDTCNGRTINPGHCIETAWFLMDVAQRRDMDKKLIDMALTILDYSWEWGWDEQYGGIINFRDCKNLPSQETTHDMKYWWPQCETIIANLYAYLLTGDEKYLERYRMVDEWAFTHFPDKEFGEWYGYLHRDGTLSQRAKGNIFKGPFHIPRMMIKSYLLCEKILINN